MINQKISLVNMMFSQDAGPPAFPTELAYFKGTLKGLDVSVHDLDIRLYNELGCNLITYHLLQYIFGGFVFSYPLSASLPFNEYPFEGLPTVELLLALIYAGDFAEELNAVAIRFGIEYQEAFHSVNKFLEIFTKMAQNLSASEVVIISATSPAAVFTGILLGCFLRRNNSDIKLIGTGNYLNVPEVANLAEAMNAFDYIIMNDANEIKSKLERFGLRAEPSKDNLPDLSGFSIKDYPLFNGLRQIPFRTARGCPYRCNFCSERLDWDRHGKIIDKYTTKSIDETIFQINYLKEQLGISKIYFTDCMINAGYERCIELLTKLAETELFYGGAVRVDHIDAELIALMKKAHMTKLIVGVETVSKKSVQIYNKGGNEYTDIVKEVIPALYETGIIPQINVLICHPYESLSDVRNSVDAMADLAELMEKEGIPFYEAPVGTICLNYPSEIYFRVKNDPDFEIVYHHVPKRFKTLVPLEVINHVEKIPEKAVKITHGSSETSINKLEFCRELYQLWSDDREHIIRLQAGSLLEHEYLIKRAWLETNIRIRYLKTVANMTGSDSSVHRLLSLIAGEEMIDYHSLIAKVDEEIKEVLVPLLLTFSMIGLIEIYGGESSVKIDNGLGEDWKKRRKCKGEE